MGQIIILRKGCSRGGIKIVGAYYIHAIHKSGLGNKATGNAATANNTDTGGHLLLFAKHRGGDALGAGEINDLAIFVQIIKLAFPVGTNGEDVYIVFLNVVNLLTEIVFYDYLIGQACGLNGLDTLKHVIAHVELAALAIKIVVGDTYDEVVAQRLGTTKEIDVTLMKKVVGAIGDYFLHDEITR